MTRSDETAARNEARFREANEAIEDKRRELGLDARTPYLCECEDASCTAIVRLSHEAYAHVRSHPRRFVIAPGHADGEGRIVRDEETYRVVEKSGRAGDIAEKTARREGGTADR